MQWQQMMSAIETSWEAYDAHRGTAVLPSQPGAKALEAESDRLLGIHDDAVEAALQAPAPSAEAVRWKLERIAAMFDDQNQWDNIEFMLPAVLREAVQFVRD